MIREGWKLIPGTANWLSSDGHYIAVYSHSYRGLHRYLIFLTGMPARKRSEKMAIKKGSLPHPSQLIPVFTE